MKRCVVLLSLIVACACGDKLPPVPDAGTGTGKADATTGSDAKADGPVSDGTKADAKTPDTGAGDSATGDSATGDSATRDSATGDSGEKCTASSCSGHGTCSDTTGSIVCQCDKGYAGATCNTCDTGYSEWPASSGTCVDDPCLPDPCTGTYDQSGSCKQTGATTFTCGCTQGAWDAAQKKCGFCTDNDKDKYGVGNFCLGPDCNDNDKTALNPGAITINNLKIGTGGTTASAAPGQKVTIKFDYTATQNTGCPGCVTQYASGVYSAATRGVYGWCGNLGVLPACPSTSKGSATVSVNMPPRLGTFIIPVQRHWQFSCTPVPGAFNNAAHSVSHGTINVVDPGCVPNMAFASSVTLNGTKDTITVAPGTSVRLVVGGSVAQLPGCLTCIKQVVIGLDNTALGCAYAGIPSSCPSRTSMSRTFTFNAPTQKGVHRIMMTQHLELSCANATAKYNGAPPPVSATIATVIVQ